MADSTDAPGANKHRGEISVTLGGTAFVLRPDFEAVSAIDAALGSIISLTGRAINDPNSLSMNELAVVVTEGIRASGRANGTSDKDASLNKIKRMIFAAGIPTVMPAVITFLGSAITGGVEGNA